VVIVLLLGDNLLTQIDINCDLGESYGNFKVGNDEKIMPYVTSANVACGFHAGDPLTISKTLRLAKKYNVKVGAHPSYPDLLGFGRREMRLTREEIREYVIYQISALQGVASTLNLKLQHVKPHGALYNKAAEDIETARGIIEAIEALDANLIVFAPPKSVLAKIASERKLRVAYEVFADRAYNPDGTLVSRKMSNAIIQDPARVVARVVKMVREGEVLAFNGEVVKFGKVHTVCIHGDTPNAVTLAETLKNELPKLGINIKPISSFC